MAIETVHLYTHDVHPDLIPPRYNPSTYRHIVGAGDNQHTVWQPGYEPASARLDTFAVLPGMPGNVMRYLSEYYINDPGKVRDCHIAAFAITHTAFANLYEAANAAGEVVEHGQVFDAQTLPVGAHGVIGSPVDDERSSAIHSLVGLGNGWAMQADDMGAPFF